MSSESSDAAWVTIETPLSPARLKAFVEEDPERLFRINSLLEIQRWEAKAEDCIAFEALNLSNGKQLKSELRLKWIDDGLRIDYGGLLKAYTSFRIEASMAKGSALVVTDDYSATEVAERKRRLDEVDRSLNQWGRDLQGYLQSWQRWSWLPPWCWYMRSVWQPMKPMARRITKWILWITVAEMALVVLLIAILAIEQ